ncbi:MAG TPA: hypothetical protein VNG13_03940, partial [Mycobacteriales bacterium]|nr:hypothetical protein [Mycobacteriales bacterium]
MTTATEVPAAQAASSAGALWAWGEGVNGQLGTGGTMPADSPVPVSLPAGTAVRQAAVNLDHGLAVTSTGSVFAWGLNGSGQLGDGETADTDSPVQVEMPSGVIATGVAADNGASYATATNGSLYQWGSGASNVPTPVSFPAAATITQVAADLGEAVALAADGTVYAWGQVPTQPTGQSATPVPIVFPPDVTIVQVAPFFAVSSAGGLYSWQTGTVSPVPLPTGELAVQVAYGGVGLVRTQDGKAYAWGADSHGQLGNGTVSSAISTQPTQVLFPSGALITDIAAGSAHGGALSSSGVVYGWGSGYAGQLGDGAQGDRDLPTPVAEPAGLSPVGVVAGADDTLLVDGTAAAAPVFLDRVPPVGVTGSGYSYPFLASGEPSPSYSTASSSNLDGLSLSTAGTLSGTPSAAGSFSFTVTASNSAGTSTDAVVLTIASAGNTTPPSGVATWGEPYFTPTPASAPSPQTSGAFSPLPAGLRPVQAAAGFLHAVALASDGSVWSWGYGNEGELGDGTFAANSQPVPVALPAGAQVHQVATDPLADTSRELGTGNTSVAVMTDGSVYAWGDNASGQLGNANTDDQPVPIRVALPAGVQIVQASVGLDHVLALSSAGTVYAWGDNASGELGDGSTTSRASPVLVQLPAGVSVTQVSAGWQDSYALTSTGQLYAWGAAQFLGQAPASDPTTPVQIVLPAGVSLTQISAGDLYVLAVTSTGQVIGWGYNYWGDLGDGTNQSGSAPAYAELPAGVAISEVVASNGHSLALSDTGQVYAWGRNEDAQLGDGQVGAQSDTPVLVSLPGNGTATQVAASFWHNLAVLGPPPGGPATYHAVAPYRALDTRYGLGAPRAKVGPHGTVMLTVAGVGGLPASGVNAVTLNLTATDVSSISYLSAYPTGDTRGPNSSNLNVV